MASINGIEAVELIASADPALAAAARGRGRWPVFERTVDQPSFVNGVEGVIFGTSASGTGTVIRLDSADPALALEARQRGQRAVVVVDSSGAVVPSAEWYESASYDTLAAVMDFNNDRYALPEMGSEVVTNGTFDSDITGWTLQFNGTITHSSGRIRVTADGGASAPRAVAPLAGLTIGKLYQAGYTPAAQNGGINYFVDITLLSTGGTAGAVGTHNVGSGTTAAQIFFFTATQTTHYISLRAGGTTSGHYNEFDNVSVKEVMLLPTGRTYGSELLDNGDFSTGGVADASLGWVLKTPAVGTETMTISGGTLNLTGDGTNSAWADQSFTTVASQVYEMTLTYVNSAALSIGTSQGGTQIGGFAITGGASAQTTTFKFTATGTTTWLRLARTSASLHTVDNVSIRALTAIGTYPKRTATFDECFAYTAASDVARTYTDANGVLKNDLAVNARRMTYANAKRQLRLENAGTNSIRNNSMQGAAVGTPGTIPTNWFEGLQGLTRQVVAVSTENGIDYIDLRFSGSPSGTGDVSILFDSATAAAALTGQTWNYSLFQKLVSGSLTNVGRFAQTFSENTSGGAFVAGANTTIANPGASLSRLDLTRTLSGGGTVAAVQASWKFAVTSGQAVDLTVRIGWPQLEQSAFATDPIRTSGVAVTRAIETARLSPLLEAVLQRAQGSVLVRGQNMVAAAGRFIGGPTGAGLLTAGSGLITILSRDTAGAAIGSTLAITSPVARSYAVSMGFDAAGHSLDSNDATVTSTTGTQAARSEVYLGRANGAGSYADGYYDLLAISPERLPNDNLTALTVAA